jgi:hypothetical protein
MGLKGHITDAAMLALTAYLAAQHPAWSTPVRPPVSLPQAAAALSALPAMMASGAGWNASSGEAATLRAVYEYTVGSDLGAAAKGDARLAAYYASDEWKNTLVLPQAVRDALPHGLASWARNLLAGWALYLTTGGLWAAWIYGVRADVYFPNAADRPSAADVWLQMKVSLSALVLYTGLPSLTEWMVERGFTRAYWTLEEVGGWPGYFAWLALYLLFVEWGIYWVHRGMHDSRTLYDWLHRPHVSWRPRLLYTGMKQGRGAAAQRAPPRRERAKSPAASVTV